jgi:hypothetical protein
MSIGLWSYVSGKWRGKETGVSSIECRVKHSTLDTRHSELGIVTSDQ